MKILAVLILMCLMGCKSNDLRQGWEGPLVDEDGQVVAPPTYEGNWHNRAAQ